MLLCLFIICLFIVLIYCSYLFLFYFLYFINSFYLSLSLSLLFINSFFPSPPPFFSSLRKIIRLKVAEAALSKEDDKASKQRLKENHQKLVELEEEASSLSETWLKERESIGKGKKMKEELEGMRMRADKAQV